MASQIDRIRSEWKFYREAALQQFLLSCLQPLFDVQLVAREFKIEQGSCCDILAVNALRQAVIIELKNTEDPQVISQLKRYESALLRNKPFQDKIDYQQPIRLIAVAPSFDLATQHQKNVCELRQFGIVSGRGLTFKLKNLSTGGFRAKNIASEWRAGLIPADAPSGLIRILNSCLQESRLLATKRIIQVRDRILAFDPKIQEVNTSSGVKYGREGRFCIELHYFPKGQLDSSENQSPAIILALPPHPGNEQKRQRLKRTRIWTDWKWDRAVRIENVRNLGGKLPEDTVSWAKKESKQQGHSLNELIDLALSEWASRLR